MKKLSVVVSILLVLMMVLNACSPSGGGKADNETSGSTVQGENLTENNVQEGMPGTIDAYAVEGDLVIGTAVTTGTYYYVGAAIGNAVDQAGKLSVLIEATNGSMENVKYVQSGDIDIGMANSESIYGAYHGELAYSEAGPQDIVQVASLYSSCLHFFVREDSDIQNWEDLKGKKVSLGIAGSAYVTIAKLILEEYGIDCDTDLTYFNMDPGESATKLADGDIDAVVLVGGAPLPGIESEITNCQFRFIGLEEDVRRKLLEKFPYATESVMPANTYFGQDYDVPTISFMTTFFCSPKADEDVIYAFIKIMIENLDTYADTNAATKEISLETIAESFIPLHPGAEKYYREIGLITD